MSDNKQDDLSALRVDIDAVDEQIINLLARRLQIVHEVGEVKSSKGIPIVCLEREARLLEERKKQAKALNLSAEAIERLMLSVMQTSYQKESGITFQCTAPQIESILIVGGNGQLGSCFVRFFKQSQYDVRILEKENWQEAEKLCQGVGLVLLCVPIDVTCDVITKLPQLAKECILADITSIKQAPIQAMKKHHKGPVLGLHPMFGPDITSFAKQTILVCPGRNPESSEWLIEQFKLWGAIIKKTSGKEHDNMMSIIQALRHFTSFHYGCFLAQHNIDIDLLLAMSSPIYRIELIMIARLFAQDPNLYADIIFASEKNKDLIFSFYHSFEAYKKTLCENNKVSFVEKFNQARHYFGEYANKLKKESSALIDIATAQGLIGDEDSNV